MQKVAVVPLGGGISPDGKGLGKISLQRLDLGVDEYRRIKSQGKESVLFAIGGPHKITLPDGNIITPDSAIFRRDYLLAQQIPQADIILVDNGEYVPNRDTWFEAFQIRRTAKKLGVREVIITTNTEHEERVKLIIGVMLRGMNIEIKTVDSGGLINLEAERKRVEATKKLIATLPEEIPDPESWHEWCISHAEYYQLKEKTYDEVVREGQGTMYVGFEIGVPGRTKET